MNRKDEQLISQFMLANKQEIANNGFSRKVMSKLPASSAKLWSDILTIACVISCCILFYAFDGFSLILQSVREVLKNQTMELMNQPNSLWTSFVAIATIAILGIRSIWAIKE